MYALLCLAQSRYKTYPVCLVAGDDEPTRWVDWAVAMLIVSRAPSMAAGPRRVLQKQTRDRRACERERKLQASCTAGRGSLYDWNRGVLVLQGRIIGFVCYVIARAFALRQCG
jgi:hypothetical protein